MKAFLVSVFLLISNMVTHAESIVVDNIITPDTAAVFKTIDGTKLSLHILTRKDIKLQIKFL